MAGQLILLLPVLTTGLCLLNCLLHCGKQNKFCWNMALRRSKTPLYTGDSMIDKCAKIHGIFEECIRFPELSRSPSLSSTDTMMEVPLRSWNTTYRQQCLPKWEHTIHQVHSSGTASKWTILVMTSVVCFWLPVSAKWISGVCEPSWWGFFFWGGAQYLILRKSYSCTNVTNSPFMEIFYQLHIWYIANI